MSDETPRLKLAQLVSLQELNAITWNEALARLDTLVDLRLNGQAINTPPAAPADGDAYLIGTAPTGAWSGSANQIAACLDGTWRFYAPYDGLKAFVMSTATLIVYQGGTWRALGSTDFATKSGSETLTNKTLSGSTNNFSAIPNAALVNAGVTLNGHALALGGSLALTASDVGGLAASGGALTGGLQVPNLGIAAAPDATNKLAISSAAVLFNHAGADARLYLNKAATANTASTLYETNYSGRAEVGLCGDDNFHFKVSANAATWYDALTIAAASGRVTANYGLALAGSASGATVLQAQAAATGTLTLPAATDTLVGRATTDTLINKSFSGPTTFWGDVVAVASANYPSLSVTAYTDTYWMGGRFGSIRYRGTYAAPAAVQEDDYVGWFDYFAFDGAAPQRCAQIVCSVGGPVSAGIVPGSYAISITNTAGALVQRLAIGAAGHWLPGTDNAQNIGSASNRIATVYAGTGTINTSAAAAKTGMRALNATELKVAAALAAQVRLFRFADAVDAKGEAARLHAGMIYEEVVAAFAAAGLDPLRYGIVCRDPAMKTVTRTRFVVDADGNAAEETGEETVPDTDENGAPKYHVGLRYDELAQFVLAGLAARLAALEAR